jgi:hypothetical protein
MTDSYEKVQLAQWRKYATTHVSHEFDEAFAALQPVAVRYYNDSTFAAQSGQPLQPTPCFKKPTLSSRKEEDQPCCHFSWHGPQFWGLGQCMQMVKDYEQDHSISYRWVSRVRPDTNFAEKQYSAVRNKTPRFRCFSCATFLCQTRICHDRLGTHLMGTLSLSGCCRCGSGPGRRWRLLPLKGMCGFGRAEVLTASLS